MVQPSPTTPTRTEWPIDIYHGLFDQGGVELHGWGFSCNAHDPPDGRHGYQSVEAVMADLRVHLSRCPGRG